MNELISKIRHVLFDKKNVGVRIPKFLGIFFGGLADIFAKVFRKNLPISYIRVQKFIATTQFDTSITKNTGFEAPFKLNEAIEETLKFEFRENNHNKITFDTE